MKPERLAAVWLNGAVADVTVAGGRIAAIDPAAGPAQAMLLPPLVDAHVHLDKTHAVDRIPARPKSLSEAIDLAAADKARWTDADLRARASRALAEAEAHGIAALRTHVDWPEPARPRAWDVLGDLAAEWRGRVRIDRAALVPLDLLGDPDLGPGIAAEVAAADGVLGAFVYRNEHLPEKLERTFALAERHEMLLDFHVDEGLDRDAQGFDTIVALTERRRHGRAGAVRARLCAERPPRGRGGAAARRGRRRRGGADGAADHQRLPAGRPAWPHPAAARARADARGAGGGDAGDRRARQREGRLLSLWRI